MASFALITEGITDQVAISAVLYGLYDEEPEIRLVQPLRDATDEGRQGNRAGWEKVFEYCALDDFAAVFSTNDYVIIQVDTDVCGHPNFPVAVVDENGERSAADLVEDVRSFINGKIAPAILAIYGRRILYAISVHSLECWLLPLYGMTTGDKGRTKNCESHLTRVLNRKNIEFKKDYRTYTKLAKPLEKSAGIDTVSKHNESFALFIASLPR
jgi:hypothetical protein